MFNGNTVGGRQVGVGIPAGQLSPGQAAPRTLIGLVKGEVYGARYSDENGVIHDTVLNKFGDTWYMAPNGENYAATLRPLAGTTWLTKLLDEKVADEKGTVPVEDAVDVSGG